jgi:ABC-type multidrug transport system ATPase subunit
LHEDTVTDLHPLEDTAETTDVTAEARADDGALVSCRDATVRRPGPGCLAGLDLDVYPGEVVVLTGPAGAGKPTVLFTLLGFEEPLAGTVKLFGHEPRLLHHDAMMDLRSRAVLASVLKPPLANLSVRQNLEVPLMVRGFSGEEVQARIAGVLAELALERVAELRPANLSALQLARAALARALVLPAELFLLDEPMGAFEADEESTLTGALARRREAGATFLITTKDPAPLSPLAPRIVDVTDLLSDEDP